MEPTPSKRQKIVKVFLWTLGVLLGMALILKFIVFPLIANNLYINGSGYTLTAEEIKLCEELDTYSPKEEEFKSIPGVYQGFSIPVNDRLQPRSLLSFDEQGVVIEYDKSSKYDVCYGGGLIDVPWKVNVYFDFVNNKVSLVKGEPLFLTSGYIIFYSTGQITLQDRLNKENKYTLANTKESSEVYYIIPTNSYDSPYNTGRSPVSIHKTSDSDVLEMRNVSDSGKNIYFSISQKEFLQDKKYSQLNNAKNITSVPGDESYYYKEGSKTVWSLKKSKNEVKKLGQIPEEYKVDTIIPDRNNRFVFWNLIQEPSIGFTVNFYIYDAASNKTIRFNPNKAGEFYQNVSFGLYNSEVDHRILGLRKDSSGNYVIDSISYQGGNIKINKVVSVASEIFKETFSLCDTPSQVPSVCFNNQDIDMKYISKNILAIRTRSIKGTVYTSNMKAVDFSAKKLYSKTKTYDFTRISYDSEEYTGHMKDFASEHLFSVREDVLNPQTVFKNFNEQEYMNGSIKGIEFESDEYNALLKDNKVSITQRLEDPLKDTAESEYLEHLQKDFQEEEFDGILIK